MAAASSSAPSPPLDPGVHELHVTGLDPATLAVCCPGLSVIAAGDTSVLGAVLDDNAMPHCDSPTEPTGGRVLAIFHERHHRPAPATPARSRPRVAGPGTSPAHER